MFSLYHRGQRNHELMTLRFPYREMTSTDRVRRRDLDGGTGTSTRNDNAIDRCVAARDRIGSADRWCHGIRRDGRADASIGRHGWVEPTGRRDDASSVNCQRNHCRLLWRSEKPSRREEATAAKGVQRE